MNKFLTALAALAVVATPVAAEARHRDHDNRRGNGVESFLGGLLVGAIVGAAVSSAERDRRDREDIYYDRRYRDLDHPRFRDGTIRRRVCFEEQRVEEIFGRLHTYYVYRCR